VTDLRGAAKRAGPHRSAWRQLGEGPANQGIAHVLARGNRGDRQSRIDFGRHIFQAMDGQIDVAVEQGFFDFLDEQRLGPDL